MEQNKTNLNSNSSCSYEEKNEYSHFAEIVIRDALQKYQRELLLQKIDITLQERNKEEFLRLTEELKKIS